MRAPIVIISFNRPQFLHAVLSSLKAQRSGSLDGREIHLFQDGAVNHYSQMRYARDEDIAASVATFRRQFPMGIVHHSETNIGVCENFLRAERYIFETRDFACAYFFEDDLVLSPVYLEMMEYLESWASTVPNVAYFAAYGDLHAEPNKIVSRRRELMTLDHHWAFGLQRSQWRKMQPLLDTYYATVVGTDYSRRDDRAVLSIYQALDAAPAASSQDAAKGFACDRLGFWRCMTVMPFARYIGNVGQHMTPKVFAAMGYDRTIVATEPVLDLDFPDVPSISVRVTEQRDRFKWIRTNRLPELIKTLRPRRYNPLRICDEAEVTFAYRLFLNREPSDEDIRLRGGHLTAAELVKEIMASDEYRSNCKGEAARMCSREDVIYAYQLCLHRDVDSDEILELFIGKRSASSLVNSIWQGNERRQLWGQLQIPGLHSLTETSSQVFDQAAGATWPL